VPGVDRITVTLPRELIDEIDRWDSNRSRFVAGAVREEVERRRREELKRSLEAPHEQAEELAEAGFDDWASRLPAEDATGLVDLEGGSAVRWIPGRGWEQPE
jgi:hypothetical protein